MVLRALLPRVRSPEFGEDESYRGYVQKRAGDSRRKRSARVNYWLDQSGGPCDFFGWLRDRLDFDATDQSWIDRHVELYRLKVFQPASFASDGQ